MYFKEFEVSLSPSLSPALANQTRTVQQLLACSSAGARAYLLAEVAGSFPALPLNVFKDCAGRDTCAVLVPKESLKDPVFLSDLKFAIGIELEPEAAPKSLIQKAVFLAYAKQWSPLEDAKGNLEHYVQLAFSHDASDLHFSPQAKQVQSLFRVDGRLIDYHKIFSLPSLSRTAYDSLVQHLRVLADLDITEHSRPQDGGFSLSVYGQEVRLRLSLLPGKFGCSAALRLVGTDSFQINEKRPLEGFNLDPQQEEVLNSALTQRSGVILFTGSTGSGKSTILQACLYHLRERGERIISIEDPVERVISGITQVEINSRAGMAYLDYLPSVLRQDPDIINVGELREQDSVKLALEAGLTGHLVLSSLHAESVPAAISRLREFGLSVQFLLDSLKLIANQRLVATNCNFCLGEVQVEAGFRDFFKLGGSQKLFASPGCPSCCNSGIGSRIPEFEIFSGNDLIELLTAEQSLTKNTSQNRRPYSVYLDLRRKLIEGRVSPQTALGCLGL